LPRKKKNQALGFEGKEKGDWQGEDRKMNRAGQNPKTKRKLIPESTGKRLLLTGKID